MNSLQRLFRLMLLVWLLLVVSLGVAVSRSTSTTYMGNTMAFLFSGTGRNAPEVEHIARKAPPIPEDAAPEEPPAPEWTPLPAGKKAGRGALGSPSVEQLENGAVAVVMQITGEVGDVSFYTPRNVTGATVDFIGEWSSPPYMKRHVSGGCLSLAQTAGHKGYLRVSGVAAQGVQKLEARAEYSATKNAVRVVFSPAQDKGK